jgi:dienelactone hydrolase
MRFSLLLPLLSLLGACAGMDAPTATSRVPARTQLVQVPGPEGVTLRALLALPEGPARGATIIALHGCGGLARPEMRLRLPAREADWAARLTEAGHPVLFPDSFGSRGQGEQCSTPEAISPRHARRADAHAAATWALAQPWSQPGGVVLLGWSHGGSTTLAAAGQPAPEGLLRAAIAYYPGCGQLSGWQPAVPTLMLLGGADNWTAPGPCRRLGRDGRAEVETYAGAAHGFDHPGQPVRSFTLSGGRMVTTGTDPAGRAASIARVEGFLATHGGVVPQR